MSDEEKKAIDELKEEIKKPLEVPEDKFDIFILYNIESAKIILNLIEKKQEEIEVLQNVDLTTIYLNGFYDGEKKVADKIKAKVMEVKDRPVKDMFISATRAKLNTIIDLESLLEKE